MSDFVPSSPEVRGCRKCPIIQRELAEIARYEAFKQKIIDMAFDPKLVEQAEVVFPLLSHPEFRGLLSQMGIDVDLRDHEELVVEARQSYAAFLEHLEVRIGSREENIAQLTIACSNPLRMRGTKAGRVVTATLCNSPELFDGLTDSEPVHIQRDRSM